MSQPPNLSSLSLNDSPKDLPRSTQSSRPTSSSHQPKTPANPKSRPNPPSEDQETRDAALRAELDSVRRVNQVIEGVLGSLEKAKGNMETVTRTVTSATTLLDTWTRILSRTEHTQRLLLHPAWNGASDDLANAENDSQQRQRMREMREAEEERRREAAEERRLQEEERRRVAAETPKARGRGRGRAGSVVGRDGAGSVGGQATGGAQRGTAAQRRAALSGYGRVRGRGVAGVKRGG